MDTVFLIFLGLFKRSKCAVFFIFPHVFTSWNFLKSIKSLMCSTHFCAGSFARLPLLYSPTSWSGTCLRLRKERSSGTWCFTASFSQCRRLVGTSTVTSSSSLRHTSLANGFFLTAVLPCAIFSPHHVYQQRPERARLGHRLPYVKHSTWFIYVYMYIFYLFFFQMCWFCKLWGPLGMTVEVLGTVLGTAIQGQIVGGVSTCPTEPEDHNSTNTTLNTTIVSLEDSVSVWDKNLFWSILFFLLFHKNYWYVLSWTKTR